MRSANMGIDKMIDYKTTAIGDIVRLTGYGAPGFASIGDLLRVTEVRNNAVTVEDRDGKTAEFLYNCGRERLDETEWKADFPDKTEAGKCA